MYIDSEILSCAFSRMATNEKKGKSFLEKTSSLMYFLAFDILSKKRENNILDFNHKTPDGQNNRRDMAYEFARLVTLGKDKQNRLCQVLELGVASVGGAAPEKRLSSNFYTVQLKKASGTSHRSDYPNRPAPLLTMGKDATGFQWGITHHDDWENNILRFLVDVKANTPFTDLAIFVCRNDSYDETSGDWRESLYRAIREKFLKNLADFWCQKIDSERVFVRHFDKEHFFSTTFPCCEDYLSCTSQHDMLKHMQKSQLIERIDYLEKILTKNAIKY